MMKKVAKTIEKRLNGMRHGVSNGNEESMNNKIRMLRIKAR
ncbi:transposase [Escherichia coli]|nr:transposase [Escherichia coli]EZJ25728.1 transposase family protein [Escherichia coli 1-392-07_S4_C2]KDW45019.1 transposase family protein [Escherichia coli 2-177-06_S4_C2]OSL54363.1 putative transposase [Escherichia coli H420]EFL9629165.1 transposase [Escherichia coli]